MKQNDELFLTLLKREHAKLLRIARALTGSEADARDMLQEATITAYHRFGDLRGGADSFAPWIRRILVNRCRNLLRDRSRLVALDAEVDLGADPQPGPVEQAENSLLWDEVMGLEPHHRQVLVLRYLVDLPVDEIAALLRVPSGTVKSRINRALGALRKRLVGPAKGADYLP